MKSLVASDARLYRPQREPNTRNDQPLSGRSNMPDKVLFVDDEPAVLDGYKRMLHREFEVSTAVGGEQALVTMREQGPFSVIISDMRMPGMNGAQFLAEVRHAAPDTIRMLLTGYTDLSAAVEAVNEGNIFRFLTKPCEKEVIAKAITTGFVQYRLVRAEKELLENTLMGSIKVLTDVLSAAVPEAFGRSMRIARLVRHLTSKFNLPAPWRFEAAAMLSQLGCVTLDPDLIQSAYMGDSLSPEDQTRFAAHPQVAKQLLVNIPRLEPIAWMIGEQLLKDSTPMAPEVPASSATAIVFGAKMLRLAVAFDSLKMTGLSHEEAIAALRGRRSEFGSDLVEALASIKPENATTELRRVPASKLMTGMILYQEIKTKAGILVVAKGQEITHALLIKLDNFARAGTIDRDIMVLVPV
ncbi:MAG: HD domain-containing phosphohydrolase [Terriglobales bacterium]